MTHQWDDYGLWSLVILNSAIFILFAFSFFRPSNSRDWRAFGAFSAFLIALFTEMYGIPLTIYLLSGWLQTQFPEVDVFTHDSGHLLSTILQLEGNPHFNILHLTSTLLTVFGFMLIAAAWRVLHRAQHSHHLATTGPYAHMRHPQYVGFIIVMTAFLLQWPTILTVAMFPILVVMYLRLARSEEDESRLEFGETYDIYAAKVPAFLPRFDFKYGRLA